MLALGKSFKYRWCFVRWCYSPPAVWPSWFLTGHRLVVVWGLGTPGLENNLLYNCYLVSLFSRSNYHSASHKEVRVGKITGEWHCNSAIVQVTYCVPKTYTENTNSCFITKLHPISQKLPAQEIIILSPTSA